MRLCRFSRTRACIAGVLAVSVFALVEAAPSGLQVPASTGEGAGRTVWDGVFTEEQARRGRGFYAEHCAGCHGAALEGGEYRALKGDRFWTTWQDTTVDSLLRHIGTNMPHSEDGSLKGTLGTRVYADIVAHILSTNEFPAGAGELTDASSAGVPIVRKEGPRALPSGSFAHVVGCLARGPDRAWRLLRGSQPARVLDGKDVDRQAPLGDREYPLMFVITSLDKFVGHRMSVRALLMGGGGAQGLNVSAIESVSATCE